MSHASEAQGEDPPTRCPVCGGDAWLIRHSGLRDRQFDTPGEFQVRACQACGVWRLWPVPEDLSVYYPDEYGQHAELDRSNFVRRPWHRAWKASFSAVPRVRRVARSLLRYNAAARDMWSYLDTPPDSVFDYGCGSGAFVGAASQMLDRAYGVDFSQHAVAVAASHGITCSVGTYENLPDDDQKYDLVRMWHVLEHVPEPVRALTALRTLLNPNGRLVVAVPNTDSALADMFGRDWFQLDAPRHLWGFSESSLRRALDASGYQVERVLYDSSGYPVHQSMAYALAASASEFSLPLPPKQIILDGLDAMAQEWNEQRGGDSMIVVASLRSTEETGD